MQRKKHWEFWRSLMCRETGDIVSIEKQGYTRQGHLIRPAEVIIVKN